MTVHQTYEAVRTRVKEGMTAAAAIREVADTEGISPATVNWRYYDVLKKKREQAAAAREAKAQKDANYLADQFDRMNVYAVPLLREARASVALDGETQCFEKQAEIAAGVADATPFPFGADAGDQIKYRFGSSGTQEKLVEVEPLYQSLGERLRQRIIHLEGLLDAVNAAEREVA